MSLFLIDVVEATVHKKNDTILLKTGLESLQGYEMISEEISRERMFSGLPLYRAAQGWEEKDKWLEKMELAVGRAYKTGKISRICSPFCLLNIYKGLRLGYPLRAILDFMEFEGLLKQVKINRENGCGKMGIEFRNDYLLTADIPEIWEYEGELPVFSFYARHKNDSGIISKIACWRKTLQEFYASDWHQKIKQDPRFLEARRIIMDY